MFWWRRWCKQKKQAAAEDRLEAELGKLSEIEIERRAKQKRKDISDAIICKCC